MKRIFVGIKVSEKIADQAKKWREKYERLPVRWIKPENLHITLVPPWPAGEDEIEEIKNILDNIKINFSAFEFRFERISFGPDPRRPRLIWASGKVPEVLDGLKNEIARTLGRPKEVRPFLLHLTLARFRPEEFSRFSVKEINDKINWKEKAASFELLESRLTTGGAEYELIARVPLKK